MPFNSPKFPGRSFKTVSEYQEACIEREKLGSTAAPSSKAPEVIPQVTAVVMPAPPGFLEGKISRLERKLDRVGLALKKALSTEEPKKNSLEMGTILEGESRGKEFTLEVIPEGFLCSNGEIYQSLSGAALGVSGNRRSGWKFWKNSSGTPIGQVIGRFKESAADNPFNS